MYLYTSSVPEYLQHFHMCWTLIVIIHFPLTQDLAKVVCKCLDEATQREYQSVAFPALGTGKLGFQPKEVARCMIETMVDYVEKHPDSSIQLIEIVIYHNDVLALQVRIKFV